MIEKEIKQKNTYTHTHTCSTYMYSFVVSPQLCRSIAIPPRHRQGRLALHASRYPCLQGVTGGVYCVCVYMYVYVCICVYVYNSF